MNDTVPLVTVAAEVGVDADTLASAFGDAVTHDDAAMRAVAVDIARHYIDAHRASVQAEQNRKTAQREAARQRPHPVRERIKALRRQQEKWTHVGDIPAFGRLTADSIEASADASAARMDEMLGGELVRHPIRQETDK